MTFNWCLGPDCHTSRTVDRIRGSKGNKVLRTRKITVNVWNKNSFWQFFCGQTCLHNFLQTHIQSIVAIAPRREPLETPIEDLVRTKHDTGYGRIYYDNVIKEKEIG
tara:strand:- start:192 stop:512 length:321 start_codon:yes stop_codon:yes gene_type:complete